MFTILSPIEEKLELKYGKQQGLNIYFSRIDGKKELIAKHVFIVRFWHEKRFF